MQKPENVTFVCLGFAVFRSLPTITSYPCPRRDIQYLPSFPNMSGKSSVYLTTLCVVLYSTVSFLF